MSRPYDFLFFDLDHTLWDFDKNANRVLAILYQHHQLQALGIPSLKAFQMEFAKQNQRFWKRFRKGYITREALRLKRFWHTLAAFNLRKVQLSHDLNKSYTELLPLQNYLMPGATEILSYLKEKEYFLGIITNGHEPTQRNKLINSGIESYFSALICPQACGYAKPKSQIFQYALHLCKAEASNSLMIGDALDIDILGAQQIGMAQVFLNPEELPHAENPTYEIQSLSELQEIL